VAQTRYLPYGQEGWTDGTQPTDFTFTGQRREGFGLMDYQARYYDPRLGRFVSADSIVPDPLNPQLLNRYSYAGNNSLRYDDPDGHGGPLILAAVANPYVLASLALVGLSGYWSYQYGWGPNAEANRQALATSISELADSAGEGLGTVFTPPPVPPSSPGAFPLEPLADPYYIPGPELGTPEWPGLPGVPLEPPETGKHILDFPSQQPESCSPVILAAEGRAGKQQRLRELANDPKASSADRGWIKQEIDQIERGQRHSIRVPPGKNLAHRRGFEAKEGFDYEYSDLQDIDLHRLQHKYEGY
jgi:RHS repeat-associated protein